MQLRTKFLFVFMFLLFLNIAAVCANDGNSSDISQLNAENTTEIEKTVEQFPPIADNNTDTSNDTNVEKTTPQISISSKNVKSKDTLEIFLENSTGNPLSGKKLKVTFNNKPYSLKTNSKGIAKLNINLPAKTYKLTISFDGDDELNPISKSFSIKVSKLKTRITESANFVVKGNYLYFHMVDSRGDAVKGKKIKIRFNGKTYTKKTNSKGKVKLKVKSSGTVKVRYAGDKQYKSSSKKVKVNIVSSRSINIGNSKLLTKGYLRIYLKVNGKALSKKVTVTIGGKKLSKKANSEGIAIIKPKVKAGAYVVKAKVGKYYSAKNV